MRRTPVRAIRLFAFSVVAVAVLAAGCNRGTSDRGDGSADSAGSVAEIANAGLAFSEDQAGVPFVFMYADPGYVGPGSNRPDGLLLAIWPDGNMVRAVSASQAGRAYSKGRLTAAEVGEVRRILGESGILQMSIESNVAPDRSFEAFTVRWGKTVRTWAHSPGFENTGNASSANVRITELKKRLLAITPADSVPEPVDRWASYQHSWYK